MQRSMQTLYPGVDVELAAHPGGSKFSYRLFPGEQLKKSWWKNVDTVD
jgi:hypothetical protein